MLMKIEFFKKLLNFVLLPTSRATGFWGKPSALGLVDILTRVNTLYRIDSI